MRCRLTFYLAILYVIDVCRLYIYRLECFDFLKEWTKFYHHTDILNGAMHSVKFLNFVNFTKCALFSFCDLPLNLPCTAYIFTNLKFCIKFCARLLIYWFRIERNNPKDWVVAILFGQHWHLNIWKCIFLNHFKRYTKFTLWDCRYHELICYEMQRIPIRIRIGLFDCLLYL